MSDELINRTFDALAYQSGSSLVITLPKSIIKRFKIKNHDFLEVTIHKGVK